MFRRSWYIFEYEEDKVAPKNLAKNGEDKMRDLNRINRLKIEKWKFGKRRWKNLEEKAQRRKNKKDKWCQGKIENYKSILLASWAFAFLLHRR